MNTSREFDRFRVSCFENSFGATRDGLDVEAALSLSGVERIEAETLIVKSLEQTNDSRPFIAAGVMRIEAAAPILKARLAAGLGSGYESLRVHAAHALYQIENWSDAVAVIIDVLKNTPKTSDRQWTRMMAVEALGDFAGEPRCQAALFDAVEDEDNFIGFLAIKSLKKLFSHSREIRALLDVLQETQIEPNRRKPEYLRQRHLTFLNLESITGLQMPVHASGT